MKVQCSKCKQNYNIKDEKIPDAGAKIKCPKCQNIIVVMKPEPELPEWVSEDLTDDFGNESQSVQKGLSENDETKSNLDKKFKTKIPKSLATKSAIVAGILCLCLAIGIPMISGNLFSKSLVVKGLYLGMPLEEAVEICNKDFRKYVIPELKDFNWGPYGDDRMCAGTYCYGHANTFLELVQSPFEIRADENKIVDKIILNYKVFDAQNSSMKDFVNSFSDKYNIQFNYEATGGGYRKKELYTHQNKSFYVRINKNWVVIGNNNINFN
jgi:predicted Zn finger-like uncharacterized protein